MAGRVGVQERRAGVTGAHVGVPSRGRLADTTKALVKPSGHGHSSPLLYEGTILGSTINIEIVDSRANERTALSALEKIKEKLAPHSGLRYLETTNGIEVHPQDDSGFTVGITINAHGFTVYFDGWHDEFASEDDAVDCFMFGLTTRCRLAVMFRGRTACKWTVEGLRNGGWVADSETGMIFQPYWRRARVEYRQNRVLTE